MGISYNPSIVTEDLVLALDPQSSRFYNYKGRSVAFDGSSDYLDIASSTDFAFGTGDFTVEVWVYLNATNLGVIYSNEVANSLFLYFDSGTLIVRNYATANLITATAPSTSTWTHIAVTRSGTDLRLFFNGVQQGSTATNSTNFTQNGVEIGAYANGSQSLNGYMSNLRVVKGTALYTSNFTPPTEPLTAVTNTVLLTCQDTTIADASSSGHSITPNGNAVIHYNGPFSGSGWTDLTNNGNSGTLTNGPVFIPGGPFNNSGGSVYFDGTGDRLSASSSDFSLDGDFTVEYWIQSQNNTGNSGYVLHFGGGNTSYFGTKSGSYVLQANNNGEHLWTGVPTINTWVHLALVRSGSTVTLYEDGISLGNKTESQTFGNSTFVIADWDGQFPVTGYISNFRIIKGTALYTSNFTPPTGPLEAIDDTVLLTCQGGAITDNGPNSHAITVTNDAEAITASAFEFDGTDDYVDIGASSDFNIGTGDFTVEGWVNTSVYGSDGAYRRVFMLDGPTGNANGNFQIILNAPNGRIYAWSNTGELNYIGSSVIADGSWNHFAACRIGSVIYLYVNGDSSGSVSSSVSFTANSGSPRPRIGAYSSSSGRLNGKVSALKIYKGKGLTEDEVKRNFSALRGRYGI